jgi:dolichyl-phosphate-mannose-protein mannosyltransferase
VRRRPFALAVAAVVLLGFALRAWGAMHPEVNPGPDANAYASLAKALFLHHSYGEPGQANTSDWSAGAPLLFGAVYFVTGGVHPEAARFFVALLGAGMVLCTFLLGRRLGGRWVGVLAALLVATYPTYIENNEQLLSEPVAGFFLAAALAGLLWAADGRRLARWVVPGLALGALILTRPEYEAISLILLALVAWRVWRDAGPRAAAAGCALAALCAALVLVPWMYRNDRVVCQWTISTGGGKALFVGTFLPGGGRQLATKRVLMNRYLPHRGRFTGKYVHQYPMAPLLDRVARKHPDLPRDKSLERIGRANLVHYVTTQPVAYARMSATKLWNVFYRGSGPYMRNSGWIAYHRGLLAAGVVGLVLALWRRRTRWLGLLLVAPVACVAAISTVLLAVPRRQVPIMPLICLFVAFALVSAVRLLRGHRPQDVHAGGAPPGRDGGEHAGDRGQDREPDERPDRDAEHEALTGQRAGDQRGEQAAEHQA